MSETWYQKYLTNPTTVLQANDLSYFARSPYGSPNDVVILWSNVLQSIAAQLQGGLNWVVVTTPTQQMAPNTGYIVNNTSGLATFTLPTNFNPGDTIQVVGFSSGGWTILENTGQQIHYGTDSITPSTGSVSSTHMHDCLTMVGTIINTDLVITDSQGDLNVL